MKLLLFFALSLPALAGEYFLEAESFRGWNPVDGPAARTASGMKMLSGAAGDVRGAATATVQVKDPGRYHVWVRYSSHPKWRGPFHLSVLAGDRVLADGLFDEAFEGRTATNHMIWRSFEADLPAGDLTLRLSKHENTNSSGLSRMVDCVLLTMDPTAVPNHLNYGAQTYVRVTLGEGYEKPAYIHIFADHYHADWYAHWALGKNGPVPGIQVKKQDMLRSGESTGWCNLTPTIYQDSGAMLYITARHGYTDHAPRLKARIEFATAPDENGIVRAYNIDNTPSTVAIYVPPNLLTGENVGRLKRDIEIAEEIGKQADLHSWPTHGSLPKKFHFSASASIHNAFTPLDSRVRDREEKTLRYFGFNAPPQSHIGGAWLMKENSYCQPDLDRMRAHFQRKSAEFRQNGGRVENIAFCELTDEPTGQALELASSLPGYRAAFQQWLGSKNLTPAELFVEDWNDVRIVPSAERSTFPALYYWSQIFRTRALGDFMAAQAKLAREAYGGQFPVVANFSDGAVYGANFYLQGVDYFELLDSDDQNAIWGEDWANGASSYQCAAFNVDLMRGAARERGQKMGHHLIAHANRKPWDVKLKATSEAARGVKIFNNFCYGPTWASHEGGPYFRSHLWHGKPETWTANASITREIGAAEDLLLPAMPSPASVALLYSASSDIWTVNETFTFGFDRMHTWMALAHAQMPVDILAERQVERGMLASYKVCYLTGPNLTRNAATKLKDWVQSGGTLFMSAGAATRDEYNRPLDVLDGILPADRGQMVMLQSLQNSGRYLNTLHSKDTVSWDGGKTDVLGVKQPLSARQGAQIPATFSDGSAAMVRKDNITVCGFLPALAYVKTALDRRKAAEEAHHPLIERSYNPWDFPADVRELILFPAANLSRPVECSHPLVDAVHMAGKHGIVIPLANYTLETIAKLELNIRTPQRIARVESAVRGPVAFEQNGDHTRLEISLENNDFLMLRFE